MPKPTDRQREFVGVHPDHKPRLVGPEPKVMGRRLNPAAERRAAAALQARINAEHVQRKADFLAREAARRAAA